MTPRWYQAGAVGAVLQALDESDGNPLVVLPTGSGKSLVIRGLVQEFFEEYPEHGVIVLSHAQEILKQDHELLEKEFGSDVGIFSAGLGRKDVAKITVAGIQSVYSQVHRFVGFVGLIIIDEAHLVPFDGDGRYRTFLDRMECPFVGLTATPFRLKGGYLHTGEKPVFTDIVYDMGSGQNYKRLEEEGYISKLICKSTDIEMNADGVRKTGGDYNSAALSDKFDRAEITSLIVSEVVKFGKNYKHWLLFAIDISHAEHVAAELNAHGIPTVCVHSRMEREREEVIAEIKDGKWRAVVNVDVLTTGFDFPGIDLIAMLRPTQSPVVYVQSVGRGLRVVEDKDHCLVLDFAGNVERLGPINNVHVRDSSRRGGEKKEGVPRNKCCPECGIYSEPAEKVCEHCGYAWPDDHGLGDSKDSEIVSESEAPKDYKVQAVSYSIHQKAGRTDTLRVTYKLGLNSVSEWIAVGRPGGGGYMARHWLRQRCLGCPEDKLPDNAHKALAWSEHFQTPEKIRVDFSGKYAEIKGYSFNPNVKAEIEEAEELEEDNWRKPLKNKLPDDYADDIPF